MIESLCGELKNWFTADFDKHQGTFKIKDGAITPSEFLKEGQYFRIIGSVFNDGIYEYPNAGNLIDEEFDGAVWAMAIPKEFIELVENIGKFNAKAEELNLLDKGYASESFGGYSYTLSSSAPYAMQEWQSDIKRKKSRWRKI